MSRARWAAGLVAVALAFTAGCSSSGDAEPASEADDEAAEVLADAKERGSPEQVEILADGKVTVEEMEAAMDAFSSCLMSTDWRLEVLFPDPIAGEPHFQYQVVPDRPDLDYAEAQKCETQTMQYVQIYAQVIQEQSPMDPALRARAVTCLEDSGVPTEPKDRSAKEVFLTAGKENVDAVTRCIIDAARTEYPDRKEGIGVSPPPELFEE
jgi:hypothetical protein